MKTFKATYWRSNPQLRNGGSTRTYTIEARTLASARKKAREAENHCAYGSLSLQSIEEVEA